VLLTTFDVEELARDHTQARRAEAERERLIAQAPSPPRVWRRAGRALVQRLTRADMVTCSS
jgi:hypothetical protein